MTSALESVLSNAERNFQVRTKQFKYMESAEPFLVNETVKFDNNPDIIGFNNGVYDLIKHEFREVKYSNYLTMSCGYDYNPSYEPDNMEDMLSLRKTIIPDEATRNLLLEVMSAELTGRVIETSFFSTVKAEMVKVYWTNSYNSFTAIIVSYMLMCLY